MVALEGSDDVFSKVRENGLSEDGRPADTVIRIAKHAQYRFHCLS